MRSPILTLTTDFGLSDHYVGAMKGVILGICPAARIVDITHGVGAYEIMEGAFAIAQAYRCFPKGTVHVVVVDPGVGTARRPILMEAAGHRFIAPDNGVLSMIYAREKAKIRLISNDKYFRKPVSQTFHGRDIFSPVAAHIAAGVAPAKMGKPIDDYLRPAFQAPVQTGKRRWNGHAMKVDRFGNIVTNFKVDEFPGLDRRTFVFRVGVEEVAVLAGNYAEESPGELFAIVGSSGYYEISLAQASAAKATGCAAGSPVELMLWSE
jgi:S-adenosyl-L-methionine hydrolase (adenosine-forming)